MRKGFGFETVVSLPLCWLLLPLGLGRVSGPAAAPGEGRWKKEAEEVEGQTLSGKCCSKLFSWLRSRPDTLGVTINRDTLPPRACRGGQLLPTDAAILDGVGSATVETNKFRCEVKKTTEKQHLHSSAAEDDLFIFVALFREFKFPYSP